MADIQYLFTGISSKQPKSMGELTDELRKLELLEYKRRTDPMALASIDRRRKKVLAWIDQEEARLEREVQRVSASIDSPYDSGKFAELEDLEEEVEEPEENETKEHEESESPEEETEEHEGNYEEDDYDEDQELELIRAALTTSGATCDILEKLLGMHNAVPEDTNDEVEEIFEDRDFVPDMSSGMDLRSQSDNYRLSRFASAVLRKQAHFEDLEDSGARIGQDIELGEQDYLDRQQSNTDRSDRELLQEALGDISNKPSHRIEQKLRELGLLPEEGEGLGLPPVVDPDNRYDFFAASKSKFRKESDRDPFAEQAMIDALGDMSEEGHELPDDFWEEVPEDIQQLFDVPIRRISGPRTEDGGDGISLDSGPDLTPEQIKKLVEYTQGRRRRELDVERNNSQKRQKELDERQRQRILKEDPPLEERDLRFHEEALRRLRGLEEDYPKIRKSLQDREASVINRLVKKAQMGDRGQYRVIKTAIDNYFENYKVEF